MRGGVRVGPWATAQIATFFDAAEGNLRGISLPASLLCGVRQRTSYNPC